MKRRVWCLVMGACVLALRSSGDARQITTPTVNPPVPATNLTVSMAEFLTPARRPPRPSLNLRVRATSACGTSARRT